jgi:glutaredoxin
MNNNKKYIIIYKLEGCPFSIKAADILKKYPDTKIINIKHNDKNSFKKQNNMNTFPQIFYMFDIKEFKIGGYNDLKYLLYIKKKYNNINQTLFNDKIKDKINIKDYKIFLDLLLFLY